MNPKVLILLLVILTALFLLGAGLGLRQEKTSGGPFEPPAWAANLEERFVPKTHLSTEDIRSANPSACLEGLAQGSLSLNPGQSCAFDIAKVGGLLGGPVRRLEVCLGKWAGPGAEGDCQPLETNGQLLINLRQPDRITLHPTLPNADAKTPFYAALDIFQEGGILRISCGQNLTAQQCLLSLR